MNIVFFFLISCFLSLGWTGELPKEVHTCSKKDPNVSECLAKNMAEGVDFFKFGYKPLGIPVMEPLYVEKLEIKGTQSRNYNMDHIYEHIRLHGFGSNLIFTNVKIDHDKCIWKFDILTPVIIMEADYQIKGQILVFPINGHGKSNFTMQNMHTHSDMYCEKYEKNGNTYLKVIDVKLNMKPEKISFIFENIIPGNEQISNEVVNTLNENSEEVYKDVQQAVQEMCVKVFTAAINSAFSRLPESEIFKE